MVDLLEVIFEFTGLTGCYVFVDLDFFEVTKLCIFGVDAALVLNKLDDLLLLYLLFVTWIKELDVVSLIDKEKLVTCFFFLLIAMNIKQNALNLNFLIE